MAVCHEDQAASENCRWVGDSEGHLGENANPQFSEPKRKHKKKMGSGGSKQGVGHIGGGVWRQGCFVRSLTCYS